MSDAADSLTSTETQDTPGYDVSSPPSPPLYFYEEQKPPPYSAAPAIYLPPKTETACIYQPNNGYKSFWDISPEASSDTTPLIASSSFDGKTVRRLFVRKVSIILALQLLFTVSMMCVFTFSRSEAMQTNLCITSFIIFIVAASSLSYCKPFSRHHLWNTVGLVGVTLSSSYMVGTIASFHDTTAVVITMGATLAISVAIIAFFAETSDFTIWYGVLLILTVDMIMFGFLHLLLLLHH